MSMPDGYILPKPGIPKTLGILSLIFGVLGLISGLFALVATLFSGVIVEASTGMMKQVQVQVQAKTKADLKALDDQEKVATTDAEKASIKTQRDAIASQPSLDMQTETMDEAKEMLHDPAIMVPSYITQVMSVALSILLIVAGVGLVRLTPGGLRWGVRWGVLKLAMVFIGLGLQFLVVLPAQKPFQDKQMAQMDQQLKKLNDPAATQVIQMSKMMQGMAPAFLVGGAIMGSIYPTIMLILLNLAGARAACLGRAKPETLETF